MTGGAVSTPNDAIHMGYSTALHWWNVPSVSLWLWWSGDFVPFTYQ